MGWLAGFGLLSGGAVAWLGSVLVVGGELVDQFERLEGGPGLSWLNVILAFPLAFLAVSAVVLVGDSGLRARQLHGGGQLNRRLVAAALAFGGTGVLIAVGAAHISSPMGMDGWLGFGGGAMLLWAAVVHGYRPRLVVPAPD